MFFRGIVEHRPVMCGGAITKAPWSRGVMSAQPTCHGKPSRRDNCAMKRASFVFVGECKSRSCDLQYLNFVTKNARFSCDLV